MTENLDSPETTAEAVAAPPTFEGMNLDPSIKQALDEMGYDVPMEVQHTIYDRVMAGRDLMVQSRTGSGKTAGFGIPIAQLIPSSSQGVQALILAPTRELALQVSQELQKICAYRNLQVVPVYGGAPMGRQIEALKAGAQIVAGTPGRVLDHIRRGTFRTGQIKMLVLDECDEMLSMGFQEEIEKIISELPGKEQRQTLLFSATIPSEIERIGKRHMREYDKVVLSADFIGVHEIAHRYYLVTGMGRTRDLLRVIEYEQPESAIIFCNTRDDTNVVASFLQRHGYQAEAISSDLTQADRERVMGLSRAKQLRFLCATDIAARGIDISDLSHVFNYTFPESPEVYIHRTGRTGRAGKSGVAVSLIGPREIGSFYYLKLTYKLRPEERELPTEAELRTRREGQHFLRVAEDIGAETVDDEWRAVARRLWHSGDGERLVAALIKRFVEGERAPAQVAQAAEPARPPEPAASAPPPREPRPAEPRPAEPRPAAPPRERDGRRERPRRASGDQNDRRGRDRDRPRREPAGAAQPAQPAQQKDVPTQGSREFWETWVDEKAREDGTADVAPRTERRPAEARVPRPAPAEEPGFVRLYVNVGKREGLTPDDVTRLVTEAIPDVTSALGRILVLGTHSYLSVKEEMADQVCGALAGKSVGERAVVAERARK